jgi:hypothetical protein
MTVIPSDTFSVRCMAEMDGGGGGGGEKKKKIKEWTRPPDSITTSLSTKKKIAAIYTFPSLQRSQSLPINIQTAWNAILLQKLIAGH